MNPTKLKIMFGQRGNVVLKEAEEAIKKIKKLIAKYNSSKIADKTTFDIAWERAE